MISCLGPGAPYAILKRFGKTTYRTTIGVVISLVFTPTVKRLPVKVQARKQIGIFMILVLLVSFPIGDDNSRVADGFYKSAAEMSTSLFQQGHAPTFHASLTVPLIFGLLLCCLSRLKFFEGIDAVYLYLPAVHATGCLCCLISGCNGGRRVCINMYGWHLMFPNPVLFFELVSDLVIFLFLQRIHGHIYVDPGLRQRWAGSVFASYFALYAPIRIIYEVFRRERRIFYELTQVQVLMGIFIGISAVCYAFLYWRFRCHHTRRDLLSVTVPQSADILMRYFALNGLMTSYLLVDFLIFQLTRQLHLWKWPIQPVVSLADAYSRIFDYLPIILVPACTLYWLQKVGEPIRPWFQWHRWSSVFLIGLVMSVYYTIELLVLRKIPLRGEAFWPPIVLISMMNAFCEEAMYRLALMRFLCRVHYSPWVANVVQSLFYSIIHFMVVSPTLGLYSIVYGMVLGWVALRGKSILPAIICHFIIDLGCIGMPILRQPR